MNQMDDEKAAMKETQSRMGTSRMSRFSRSPGKNSSLKKRRKPNNISVANLDVDGDAVTNRSKKTMEQLDLLDATSLVEPNDGD